MVAESVMQQQSSSSATDERERLLSYVSSLADRLSCRSSDRERNNRDNIKYPEESFFKNLDSSIKRNSALIKKLRTGISESNRDSLLKELAQQNVTKYIGEIVSALTEAKIRMTDMPVVIDIAVHMHHRYPDFSSLLHESFTKILPKGKQTAGDMAAGSNATNVSKLRTDVRLFAELISVNVFTLKDGLPVLGQCLKSLAACASSASESQSNTSGTTTTASDANLSILLTFCKQCGEEYLGVVPYSMGLIAAKHPDITIPSLDSLISSEKQKILLKIMQEYLKHLITRIHTEKKELRRLDQVNRKMMMSRGEVTTDRREQFDQLSINLNKLITNSQQFAESIGCEFPELPPDPTDVLSEFSESAATSGEGMSIDMSNRFRGTAGGTESDPYSLFEDDDSRSFYQSIPDIKSQIPAILYKDSAGKQQAEKTDSKSASPDLGEPAAAADVDTTDDNEKDLLNTLTSGSIGTDLIFVETAEDTGIDLMDVDEMPSAKSEEATSEKPASTTTAASSVKQSNKVLMDAFLSSLTNCVSRDHVDKAAINFCTNLNSKANRNKLIRTLFTVPRNRLDLLPFYARLVKILFPVMPHVANDLVTGLKQDFKFHVRKKDQINIESKIKTMRFISELVKFELFPKFDAINCLKILLLDFTHHQITMACTLIESCGRFLYRSLDSHQRMNLLLEQMMRKKSLLPYDSPYITVIENAYYSANNSDTGTGITRIERPVMHEYVRKLLYTDLSKRNADRICRQIRKLNWDDEQLVMYIIKCMTAVYNVKFLNIGSVANLLSQLKEFHEDAVFRVIDGVLEDIKLLMEVNHVKFHQRRISMVKFLGDLYNYRLVDSAVVFQELYSFISFGVDYEAVTDAKKQNENNIDPPDNLFRIRLICTLLDSCAAYFSSPATKKKLDCFIIFFQKYYWHKRSGSCFAATESNLTSATIANSFPITIENLFIDTIRSLRPKFKFAANAGEANALVQELVDELKSKAIQMCPDLKDLISGEAAAMTSGRSSSNNSHANNNNDLNAIPEEEGEEDSNTDQKDDTDQIDEEEDDDDDEDNESGDEDNDSSSSSSSDDEDNNNKGNTETPASPAKQLKFVPCPEDDEFLKEFDKVMTESILSRSSDNVKPMANIKIPDDYETKAKSKVTVVKKEKPAFTGSIAYPAPENTMNLTVMTRSGRGANVKPVLRVVQVPLDSELAQELKQKEERIRREKEELKHLTLVMNDRIDEAEANNQSSQSLPGHGNSYLKNKNHHHRHQKGVPDGDII